jgi:hypothetical protein
VLDELTITRLLGSIDGSTGRSLAKRPTPSMIERIVADFERRYPGADPLAAVREGPAEFWPPDPEPDGAADNQQP